MWPYYFVIYEKIVLKKKENNLKIRIVKRNCFYFSIIYEENIVFTVFEKKHLI